MAPLKNPAKVTMRALTVRQPWAWAIPHAGKDVENRTWTNRFVTGTIAIHAGYGLDSLEDERPHHRRSHALDALGMALARRRPPQGLLHHSDLTKVSTKSGQVQDTRSTRASPQRRILLAAVLRRPLDSNGTVFGVMRAERLAFLQKRMDMDALIAMGETTRALVRPLTDPGPVRRRGWRSGGCSGSSCLSRLMRYRARMLSRARLLALFVLLSLLALGHATPAQDNSDAAANNVRERVQRGEALYHSGQFEAAIEMLTPVVKGNYSAIYRVFQAHQRLNKTKQFIDFALPLAEQGDANTQYFLAEAYERERKPNAAEILRWYRSSAQGGLDLAADALGRIYYSGQIGVDIDDDDALKSLWRNRGESERYFALCVQLSQPRPVSSCLRGLAVLEADKPQRSVEKVLSLLEEARDYESLWLIYEFGVIAKKAEDRATAPQSI
jgi:hypothetical protein